MRTRVSHMVKCKAADLLAAGRVRVSTITVISLGHDDVIKWERFPRYWPFVRRIHLSPVNFPKKGAVTRSFDVFFDLRLNKRFSKQFWGWRSETRLWRQCNGLSEYSSPSTKRVNIHLYSCVYRQACKVIISNIKPPVNYVIVVIGVCSLHKHMLCDATY